MSRAKDVKLSEVKVTAGAVALGAVAYLLDHFAETGSTIDNITKPIMWVAGVLIVLVLAHHLWYFSAHQKFLRAVAGEGWLDRQDLRSFSGKTALRKQAGQLRPGLKGRAKPTEYGWKVGRLVSGERYLRGRAVYTAGPRPIGIVGPTDSGKTQLLVNGVIETPGPAVVTSTKTELVQLTQLIRSKLGPTAVFNPQGLGEVGNTFMWDPVSGCENQQVADARAWALVRGGGGKEGIERADFWAGKAQEIIRAYLMAAALQGWDMGAVMHWSHNPDDYTPVNILEAHPGRVPTGWIGTLSTHLQASHNTRTGYFATVTSCVGFMDNPQVAAACRPAASQQFDVAEFIKANGTLYLVGGQQDKRIAPLLTALTEYVFGEAQRIAADRGGRLDPYLTFWLDEVCNITPVPLDQWTTDSRGWGIRIAAVIQALSQLETTWGPARASTIWGNLVTKLILPGVTDHKDLEDLAYLGGTRKVERVTENQNSGNGVGRGKTTSTGRSYERERVIEGHTIANMPRWHLYVHGLGRHPAIVRFEPGYKRVKRELRRLGRRKEARNLPALEWRPDTGEEGATA